MAQHIIMDTAPGSAKALLSGTVHGAAKVTLVDIDGNPVSSGGSGGGDASAANQTALNTLTGAVTEAPPATDTASSGLNGRLQRVAQRITSLIGQLPATLGIKAATASMSVVAAQGVPTNRSGTVTTGGTAQQLMAANGARVGFSVQNLSTGDLWINTLGTAAASQPSLKLTSGTYYETPAGAGEVGAVSIFGATTGQAFSAKEY